MAINFINTFIDKIMIVVNEIITNIQTQHEGGLCANIDSSVLNNNIMGSLRKTLKNTIDSMLMDMTKDLP
jgi:hypothetical protein